jgi:hypothetical protein
MTASEVSHISFEKKLREGGGGGREKERKEREGGRNWNGS